MIFDLIDIMPNKFPIFEILETKPSLFLRMLLVDGFRSARDTTKLKGSDDIMQLDIGDSMGPFTLIESYRPTRYRFSMKSFFFNCQTGYSLHAKDGGTELSFDLIAENPSLKEKIWWFLFKPFHFLFANKALRVIKNKVEHKLLQAISK